MNRLVFCISIIPCECSYFSYIDQFVPAILGAAIEELLIQRRMAELGVDQAERLAREKRVERARLELHQRYTRTNELLLNVWRTCLEEIDPPSDDADEAEKQRFELQNRLYQYYDKIALESYKRGKEIEVEFSNAKRALDELTAEAQNESFEMGSVEYARQHKKRR